jgi:hypothetical protein
MAELYPAVITDGMGGWRALGVLRSRCTGVMVSLTPLVDT